MDRFELTHNDFGLSEDDLAVREAFRSVLTKECGATVVRAAEPVGHDPSLWARLVAMDAVAMGVPEEVGGGGGSLTHLLAAAEQIGAFLAPVPFITQAVVARLLAAAGQSRLAEEVMTGKRIIALAPPGASGVARQLVPDAALARDVVRLDERGLVLLSTESAPTHVVNQGCTPLAWVGPDGVATVLVDGDQARLLHDRAMSEWRLLTAAALVGLTDAALRTAVEFACSRKTLGVPIGSLQGVSFQLADVAVGVGGARNLTLKAGWMDEFRLGVRPELSAMAFAGAAHVATSGTYTAVHVQGSLGFTREADVSLYFLRAKGWAALMGDPAEQYRRVGELLVLDRVGGR